MKIGSIMSLEMGIIMAVIFMSCSVRHGVEAQVGCLQDEGAGAPVSDANSLVQYWRQYTSSVCTTSGPPCWYFDYPQWDAAAIMCAPAGTCVQWDVLGDYLNEILAQCIQPNDLVQGYNRVSEDTVYYLNSRTCLPNC